MRRRGLKPPRSSDGGRRPAPARPTEGDAGWIVGRQPVLEALESSATGEMQGLRILAADETSVRRWWEAAGCAAAAARGHVEVTWVPGPSLDEAAQGAVHQGVMARAPLPAYADLDQVIAAARAPSLLVIAEGIQDPRNLGAIIRTAAAAGASGVIVPERRAAGLTPAVAKAAAGALHRVPVVRVTNVTRTMALLGEHGLWSVGLVPGTRSLWEGPDLCRPTCLVVGGEGRGLSRLVRERCDDLASLPLQAGVESLNAAVAVGIALYEVVRQRRSAGLPGW